MKELDAAFKKWCEYEGIRWRHTLGLYAYDPLPAKRLAAHLDVPIIAPSEIEGLDKQTLNVLLAEGAGWSALALPVGEKKHWIIYNPTHSEARYESSIMHELAHLILGHQLTHFTMFTSSTPVREYCKIDERSADYLGGCLQLTTTGLDWAFQHNMTHMEIAHHFGASIQMVRFRCNMTGYKH